MSNYRKDKKTSCELVEKMKEKGVTFKYISDTEAKNYLMNVNNYFRTACYRKNFQKYTSGKNKDKYIDLDFLQLTELSVLDMYYRRLMVKVCVDIEHSLKVKLLLFFENNNLNEYDVVKDFLDDSRYSYLLKTIERMKNKSYSDNLIEKYFSFDSSNLITDWSNCPVWVFLEVLSFGDFINFYFYCQDKAGKQIINSVLLKDNKVANLVKHLRNGCAHNNCIFENLNRGRSQSPGIIRSKLRAYPNITRQAILTNLTVRPILEFVATILLYIEVVSPKVQEYGLKEIENLFFIRMIEKKRLMSTNSLLASKYRFVSIFLKNIIKI